MEERTNEKTLQSTQQQVNEVVDIMQINLQKVMERDLKLEQLEKQADYLQTTGQTFQKQARRVQRKYWWKNLKMWLILFLVTLLVIAIIIVGAVGFNNSKRESSVSSSDAQIRSTLQPN